MTDRSTDEAMRFVAKSDKDVWQTPPRVLDPIDRYAGIDLDPCAGEDTDIGDRNIRPPRNGLDASWRGTVFVNPPFTQKADWLAKAVREAEQPEVDAVYFLTPDSTDTKSWWHEYIAAEASVTWFPKGRINYIDPETGEQASGVSFGSAVSVFGEVPDNLLWHWEENGDLVVRPQNAGWVL